MSSRVRSYIRQNHLALLALIVAIVGVPSAWALARNSVGPRQIKPNAVRSSDIKNQAVRGVDVRELTLGQVPNAAQAGDASLLDSLNSTDFLRSNAAAGGSLTGNYPDPGIGEETIGAAELLSFTRRESTATVASGTVGNNIWNHNTATVACNPGEQLIAGNAAWDNEAAGDPMAIVEINPDFSADSVTAKGATDVATDRTLRVIAICVGVVTS
jgi:hypothetical protein